MKNKVTHTKTFVALALGILLAGCAPDSPKGSGEEPPIPVSLARAGSLDRPPLPLGNGEVVALDRANLGTRIMGQVDRLHVILGQKVNKGTLLVSLDAADLRARTAQVDASIAEAGADFEHAMREHQRFETLFQQNSASQKELDDRTAAFRMSKARLEAAMQLKREVASQWAYTRIQAPFDGQITHLHLEEGDLARPGAPLVSMESSRGFEVLARVSENDINALAAGDRARVHIKALDTTIDGRLKELSPSGLPTGGQYSIKVELDAPPIGMRSGMYVSVSMENAGRAPGGERITIPTKALVHRGQLKGVYTLGEDQVALLRWLRLGRIHGEEVEVLTGLAQGEQYIVNAQGKLHNGAKVIIQ